MIGSNASLKKSSLKVKTDEREEHICAHCHRELALVVNYPCNHKWLCDGCTTTYRSKHNDTCPAPECNQPSTLMDDTQSHQLMDDNNNRIHLLQAPTPTPVKLTCDCCYEDWVSTYVVQSSVDCQHNFCVGCLVQAVRTSFGDPPKFEGGGLICQVPDCPAHMSPSNFRTLRLLSEKVLPHRRIDSELAQTPLTEAEARKYDRFVKEQMIPPKNYNNTLLRRVYCLDPHCTGQDEEGNLLVQDTGENRNINKYECLFCSKEMCVGCCNNDMDLVVVEWHGGLSCESAKTQRNRANIENLDKSKLLIDATTKKCPNCPARVSHYHGHACHHIGYNQGGCNNCKTDWCYRSGKVRSECQCGICDSECSNVDIVNNIDITSGWPVDQRCGCQICPDCRFGVGCPACSRSGRGCVVCLGIVEPGSLVQDRLENEENARAVSFNFFISNFYYLRSMFYCFVNIYIFCSFILLMNTLDV